MATIPTQSTIGASANGSNVDYGSASNAATAAANLSYAAKDTAARNSTITNQTPSPQSTASTTASAPTNQYSVVTSNPATQNYNSIQQDYNQNIKPNLQNSQASTQANSNLPVISGYNVSANPTGNAGETKATNQATGSSYYITPQNQAPTADDVKGILSGADTSPAPSNNGTDIPQTPAQQATAQTGINPSQENANYASSIQTESDSLTSAATQFQNVMNTISAGAIPLTPAQQSLVDATNSAFQAMTTNANLKAAALSSETGGVGDKTNAMGGQLVGIASDQAAAIAKLESGFQQENFTEKYQTVTAAYSALKDAETAKMDVLSKIHDTVLSTYQNALQAAQAQQTYQKSVEQFQQTQNLENKKLAEQTQKDLFDEHYKTEQLKMQQAGILDTNGNLVQHPSVTAGDPASQAAFLATLPPMTATQVKGLTDYTIDPNSFSSRATTGPSRGVMIGLAKQYDPNYNEANYSTIQKVNNDYTSGSTATNIKSLNTSINHIGDLSKDFTSLPNSDVTKFNSIKDWATANTGSGDVTKVVNDLNAVGGELAKTYKGTPGTDSEIANIQKGINLNSSPEQFKAFIESSMSLLGGRVNSLDESYTQATGGKSYSDTHGGQNLLNPTAVSVLSGLKNNGYGIDVKGIPYTDAAAYVKYDPQGATYLKEAVAQLSSSGDVSQADALQQAQYNQNLSK